MPVGAAPADLGVELEREVLLGRSFARASGGPTASASSAIDAASGDARDLAFVLHLTLAIDEALGRHELGVGEPLARERALLGPGDAVGLDARAERGPSPARDEHVALRGHRQPDLDLRVDPRSTELITRLLAVATVGDEHHVVGQSRAASPPTR